MLAFREASLGQVGATGHSVFTMLIPSGLLGYKITKLNPVACKKSSFPDLFQRVKNCNIDLKIGPAGFTHAHVGNVGEVLSYASSFGRCFFFEATLNKRDLI